MSCGSSLAPGPSKSGVVGYVASSSLSRVPRLMQARIFTRSTGYMRKRLSLHPKIDCASCRRYGLSRPRVNCAGRSLSVASCSLDYFPTPYQDALDKLAIPAMSAACERVFSSTKKIVTTERNRLSEDIIQACECLKAWWDNGIME